MPEEREELRPDAPLQTRREDAAHGFAALPSGTRLDNRYTIDSVIAAGGFGITYLARHDGLGRTFAIKEHFPRQFAYRDPASREVRSTDPGTYRWALDRFLQEGRSLSRCKHSNVIDVTDVFEANGTAYMVLVYEEGQSLKDWLAALGRPPTQTELDALLVPLLDALAYVHDQGLLHRDLAPDNIIIRPDGQPCLIDFGAARQVIAQRSEMMSAIVKTGFSPPEQYTSTGKAQGPWSDIYALGATLYNCVTGVVPQEATARAIEDELRPAARAAAAPEDYRPEFLAAIDRALRLKQAERPQTVAAWREMLLGNATGRATSAGARTQARTSAANEPTGPLPPARRRLPRSPAVWLALAIALAGGTGWLATRSREAPTPLSAAGVREADAAAADKGEAERRRLAAISAREEAERHRLDAQAAAAAKAEAERERLAAAKAREEAERHRQEAEAARAEAERRRREEEAREAERQKAFFTFTVCNESATDAYVAIAHFADESDDNVIRGWWSVAKGTCEEIGRFKRDSFEYYADCAVGKCFWPPREKAQIKYCVEDPGPFRRIGRPGYQCQSRERLVGFGRNTPDGDAWTWTLVD